MTRIICLIVIVLTISCYDYKLRWSDQDPKEFWITLPDNPDSCYARLDFILNDKIKTKFKNTSESYAVVELANGVSQGFISGWKLSEKTKLVSFFMKMAFMIHRQ